MGDYSISKYKPELYDENGCYSRNEWTSIGYVGNTFYKGVLSIDEYMKVEQRYIDAAITLARLSGCTYLIISTLEGKEDIKDFIKGKLYNKQLSVVVQKIKQGLKLNLMNVSQQFRPVNRNLI